MSEYTKTEWKTGDVITAEKLNNMEDGIAGGSGGSKTIPLEYDEETGEITTTLDANLSPDSFIGVTFINTADQWYSVIYLVGGYGESSELESYELHTLNRVLIYEIATGKLSVSD